MGSKTGAEIEKERRVENNWGVVMYELALDLP